MLGSSNPAVSCQGGGLRDLTEMTRAGDSYEGASWFCSALAARHAILTTQAEMSLRIKGIERSQSSIFPKGCYNTLSGRLWPKLLPGDAGNLEEVSI